MKVLDLFSGIGGFSLGLERAGIETVAFCEMDKYCQKVLKKHWPDIPMYPDVCKLKGKDFKNVEIITGGFPCQDISVAGQKKGFKHDGKRTRSGLWEEYKRLIKEIRPRYAIIENVANFRSLGLNQVVKDLWSIGYACEWHIISARSIGAPHLRERIWVITYPNSDTLQLQSRGSSGKSGEEKVFSRKVSRDGEVADTTSEGVQGLRLSGGIKKEESEFINFGFTPNSDMPRLWKSFASEKEKSEWWAEATASFCDWWKTEPGICRVDDGISERMERHRERIRKERIKMLGNSIVPQIAELIGREILKHEND